MLLNKVGQNHMAIQWFNTDQDTSGLNEIIKSRLILSNLTGSIEIPNGHFSKSRYIHLQMKFYKSNHIFKSSV